MVVLTELIPGSSSSSQTHDPHHHPNLRYDVFLSFRGADTRNCFTDYLYNALVDAGITTFLDDEEIETGEPLKPVLESAIQSSRASIIVLSKNYASSTWCLDELVLILEQKRICKQIVIPIFYHVEPTHVRKQESRFGEAMAYYKQKMESEEDAEKRSLLAQKIVLWKRALTEVADLKGRDVKDKKERELIFEVVRDINRLCVPLSDTMPLLIGMDYEIGFVSSWLTDGSCHSADILTIAGMGGIGKTSLAKHVFGLHSCKFDKSSFVEGIDTKCKVSGLLDLLKQVYGDISKNIPLQVHDVSVYTSKIKNALASKKVLLVLDDIGCLDQLDAFLGNIAFHQGSKIIITTKDASLTERCALFNPQVEPKHTEVKLNGIYKTASTELLCIHAFKSNKPKEGYKEVSEKLVNYCQGHPLALKVLGRSLQNRDVAYWEGCIKSLKKGPESDINKALKMSFDALPNNVVKELFKHITCFFVGMDRDLSETILNACDMNTSFGIPNLIDRCLLSIGWNNKLEMHSLIQEMGRDLVRQESPKKRSWCHEESMKVLTQKNGKGNLLGLTLDMRMLDKKKLRDLEPESLSEMDNLMLLQLNFVQINECFQNFPEELRWLCMHGFPLKSIHLDAPMENLVVLDMSYSKIETFDMSAKRQKKMHFFSNWNLSLLQELTGSSPKDKRLLGSLKILDLSFCEQLHTVGGFSLLPALERLILRNCTRLIEVCESIEKCDKLVHIDLRYCYKLANSIRKLKKVKTLLLDSCNSGESQIPSDLRISMIQLPSSLISLSLKNIKLSNECFPVDLSSLAMLEELRLDGNLIVSMPNCVRTLPRLQILHMNYCDKMISIENPPHTLRELYVHSYNPSIRNIKFDPGMSPLFLSGIELLFVPSSFVIDGVMKVQDLASVEEKVLHSLGWINLDYIKERHLKIEVPHQESNIDCQTQMFYEFGIFTTLYAGKEMPEWIKCRSKGKSISFMVPSSHKKLRGLNLCCVLMQSSNRLKLPMIKISNITKNRSWIYKHCSEEGELSSDNFEDVKLNGNVNFFGDRRRRYFLSYLSHWMFGPNEMEAGDHITITLAYAEECGVGVVYDDSDGKNEEEDALGYYKSWNHIIGGDLSGFQLTTGEYLLHYYQFSRILQVSSISIVEYTSFTNKGSRFKEETMSFRAFSQKKGD